jgi:hypothetical protein
MPKLLILGYPVQGRLVINRNFRGLNRNDMPSYPHNESKLKKYNQIFDFLLEVRDLSVDDGHYIRDLAVAKRIARDFIEVDEENQSYEVIEVVNPHELPECRGKFLGFDVLWKSEGNDSHILTYIDEQTQFEGKKLGGTHRDVLEKKYATAINQYVLFSELEEAESFAKDLSELTNGEIESEIVGLYAVTE